uniref:Uncharacterized protein n=1 Tax=Arundo donax TaxID=35708 RepID=A0A0A9EQB7_ARUDO
MHMFLIAHNRYGSFVFACVLLLLLPVIPAHALASRKLYWLV